jgi:hypothetical protein
MLQSTLGSVVPKTKITIEVENATAATIAALARVTQTTDGNVVDQMCDMAKDIFNHNLEGPEIDRLNEEERRALGMD